MKASHTETNTIERLIEAGATAARNTMLDEIKKIYETKDPEKINSVRLLMAMLGSKQ